mmetsp:Transcript_40427/g.72612  ORF Transcript_40427/g.72612 Transcript_40427/m.72612 type:complete len:266 (+) Transcript_40427:71-868(+)
MANWSYMRERQVKVHSGGKDGKAKKGWVGEKNCGKGKGESSRQLVYISNLLQASCRHDAGMWGPPVLHLEQNAVLRGRHRVAPAPGGGAKPCEGLQTDVQLLPLPLSHHHPVTSRHLKHLLPLDYAVIRLELRVPCQTDAANLVPLQAVHPKQVPLRVPIHPRVLHCHIVHAHSAAVIRVQQRFTLTCLGPPRRASNNLHPGSMAIQGGAVRNVPHHVLRNHLHARAILHYQVLNVCLCHFEYQFGAGAQHASADLLSDNIPQRP